MPQLSPETFKSNAEALAFLTECSLSSVIHIMDRRGAATEEKLDLIRVAQTGIDALLAEQVDTRPFSNCVNTSKVLRNYRASVLDWARDMNNGADLDGSVTCSIHHNTCDRALIYLTDSTLATLEKTVPQKSTSRFERTRQMAIARIGLDWIKRSGIVVHGQAFASRINEIYDLHCGRVESWVAIFEPTDRATAS
jgi:hypothetical protein